jgi:hypothetical protein
MLTAELRQGGCEVLSFVENNNGEQAGHLATENGIPLDFNEWVWSERGAASFEYDLLGATTSRLVIYLGPSGVDAWAEVGAAFGCGIPIYGLWAKGEQAGLMRRMVSLWFTDYRELLTACENFKHNRGL